jgi:16S rRNA (cytidine1402-2'-O)-methyltransferase
VTGAAGTLYVVATPIGNMGDVTLRALEVLRSAAVVAAEDTRLTRRLFARHGIETPMVSYHARSPASREAQLIGRLEAGDDVALVTDAGTPLVSDPGAELVREWIGRGGRVVPVPGASAVLAALVAAGLPAARWSFDGFLPRRGRERKDRLAEIAAARRTSVLFEAPGRVAATLRDLAGACGSSRQAAVCRELTKLHEDVRRGTLLDLAVGAETDPPRGEVTIVVAGAPEPASAARLGIVDARVLVERLVSGGMTRTAAAKQVAQETGLPRRELFAPDRAGR